MEGVVQLKIAAFRTKPQEKRDTQEKTSEGGKRNDFRYLKDLACFIYLACPFIDSNKMEVHRFRIHALTGVFEYL